MRFRFSPLESRGVLMGFSLGRLVALVLALMCGVGLIRSDNWPMRIVWALAIGLLLVIALARWNGRALTAWLPVLWAYSAQRGLRQNLYRGGPFARNAIAVQAFRHGRSAAVQFHPEVTADMVRSWIAELDAAWFVRKGIDADAMLDGFSRHGDTARVNLQRMLDRFLDDTTG